jgi:hypothetical protein
MGEEINENRSTASIFAAQTLINRLDSPLYLEQMPYDESIALWVQR